LFEGLDALRKLQGTEALKQQILIELVVPVRRVLQAILRNSESTSSPQILYLRDVTHETIVEEMKTEFLSTAAHELRTPMASILGFSELLLTHQFDASQIKEFLTIIYSQSQQMSVILDELLDLARIEARQGKDLVIETLSLPLVVNEVIKGFNLPLGRPAPTVVIPPDASFRADPGKAKQVILNVLSNAYKYSPPEGLVTINFVELHHTSKGLLCGISVQDQGQGMTSEQLDRVFERFFRADASGTTPGTGLGMSIAKEIMEIHGGEILVESDFGVGTSVTLLFPSANQQDPQGPADGPD
jgi:signal transduction histidine kinase